MLGNQLAHPLLVVAIDAARKHIRTPAADQIRRLVHVGGVDHQKVDAEALVEQVGGEMHADEHHLEATDEIADVEQQVTFFAPRLAQRFKPGLATAGGGGGTSLNFVLSSAAKLASGATRLLTRRATRDALMGYSQALPWRLIARLEYHRIPHRITAAMAVR